jgi:NAD(P)-dependent dehydrogenase (short-subunit alcohol dehydrogenase family)
MSEHSSYRVALVTGASSGIGKATAIAFAKEGAKVVVAARRIQESEEVVELIKEEGGDAIFLQTDVSKADEAKSLIERTVDIYGRLDWACNNAGIAGEKASVTDCTEKNWNEVISINLTGIWLCMKYELIQMLKNKTGAIVNISSVNAFFGVSDYPAYATSKHGIIGLTKSAAVEYGKFGIRINAVCPGSIYTPALELIDGGPFSSDSWRNNVPLKRVGNPEEIASAVVWLCSGGASYVTGHSLVVDGGWLA